MRRAICFLSFLTLATASTGCAALFQSNSRRLQVTTDPPGAQVLLDGRPMGTTPANIQISQKDNQKITFRLAGYHDSGCVLTSSVGAGWVILDALLGLIPIIVDAVTGAWSSIDQHDCHVSLQPAAAPAPAPVSDVR